MMGPPWQPKKLRPASSNSLPRYILFLYKSVILFNTKVPTFCIENTNVYIFDYWQGHGLILIYNYSQL